MSSVWQDYEVFAPTVINKSKFMAEESSMRLGTCSQFSAHCTPTVLYDIDHFAACDEIKKKKTEKDLWSTANILGDSDCVSLTCYPLTLPKRCEQYDWLYVSAISYISLNSNSIQLITCQIKSLNFKHAITFFLVKRFYTVWNSRCIVQTYSGNYRI